jgi:hypothetical protein
LLTQSSKRIEKEIADIQEKSEKKKVEVRMRPVFREKPTQSNPSTFALNCIGGLSTHGNHLTVGSR